MYIAANLNVCYNISNKYQHRYIRNYIIINSWSFCPQIWKDCLLMKCFLLSNNSIWYLSWMISYHGGIVVIIQYFPLIWLHCWNSHSKCKPDVAVEQCMLYYTTEPTEQNYPSTLLRGIASCFDCTPPL